MQQVTFGTPTTPPITNKWFATKQQYHVRKLYSLFFRTQARFARLCKAISPEPTTRPTPDLTTPLQDLKDLTSQLFPQGKQDDYGQHLNWAMHGLFHEAHKLKANMAMCNFHNHKQGQADAGHQTFIDRLQQEAKTQLNSMALLFDNGTDLLRLMLETQAGNDLLLRLLIEQETVTKKLWNLSTLELFSEMFPDQAETGYAMAGKSYFMGQWLEEALMTYETSLRINPDHSESRKQSHLIRAMLKDRGQSKT